MVISFLTFEILYSIKIRKTFLFHVKRFTGRIILTEFFVALVIAVSSIINQLTPFVPERYLITIFMFGYLLTSVAVYKIIKNLTIRNLFSKLEKGEW